MSPLELDDIQSGVLRPRPAPYAATYLLFRIDDRRGGRELLRRLSSVVSSAAEAARSPRDAWLSVALTYKGLKALHVPQTSLDSFSPEFREGYANSIQVNVSVWDFLLTFGRLQQQTPELVEVMNFQNIYLSPQQAKALMMILTQNIQNYEKAFGEIKLDPQMVPGQQGPVN